MDKQTSIQNSINALFKIAVPRLCIGGAVIFMLLSAMDYFSTPENFRVFLAYRMAIAGLLLLIFFLLNKYRFSDIRSYQRLIYAGLVASSITVELMILKTGGSSSSYYVGMGLIGIWAISFIPAGFALSLTYAMTVYVIYLAPIVATETISDVPAFFTANAFLLALLSSSLVLRHFHFVGLINELGLKFDLVAYKARLEDQVSDRTARLSESVTSLHKEIAERNQLKITLERIASEWRSTVDSTKDVIMLLNKDFGVVRVNKASVGFYAVPFTDIVGKKFCDLLRCEEVPDSMKTLFSMKETKQHVERELHIVEKGMWISLSADPVLDNEKNLQGAVVIIRDITQYKKLEESVLKARDEWEETFNVINDAITIYDKDRTIVRANKAARELLKLSDADLSTTKCYHAFHGTDSPPEHCVSCKTLETGEMIVSEMNEPHLNRFIEAKSLPRRDKQGEIIGMVHVVRDITDRKKAEAEQAKLQSDLLQVQKMDSIGQLAGGIAHDFNNILSSIIGFSRLALTRLPADHPVAEDLQIISDSGDRAAALTRQLLAFSRKQVLEMKVVNLESIIEDTVKLFSRLLGENIHLDLNLNAPRSNIVADVGQLEQVLMNLMVNARDAMPSGGRLTIATRESGPGEATGGAGASGPGVLLSVTDTGTGISKEVQDRMFEPFFTTKGMGKGTGLGLSTVYGIVKQHNGHITVDSELGRGTIFTIFFPVTDREVEKAEEQITPPAMIGGTETVLVVDDEPAIRKLIGNTLRSLGYRFLEASNGKDALKISSVFPEAIHLLVSDVVMPKMNGPELAEKIRHQRPGIRVIFISGYTNEEIIHEGVVDPGLVLIQKPLSPDMLAQKIREVLDQDGETKHPAGASVIDTLRILYADDDASNRRLIQRYLEPSRCGLECCENGQIAVDKFQSGSYDLVLMDMEMPVMDGRAAARAIRKWESEQGLAPKPIIAFTGHTSSEEIQACLDAGCTSHLTKPISRESLLRAVGAYASGQTDEIPPAAADGNQDDVAVRIDKDLQDIVPGYLQSRREDVQAMNRALAEKDYETIRVLGHSMKGSGGGYGFDAITRLGERIETAAKGRDPEALLPRIAELSRYLDSVNIVYE